MRWLSTSDVEIMHKTHEVKIGKIKIGGGLIGKKSKNPIAIQSMTNTDTADIAATVRQFMALADAGAELIRLAVNSIDAAKAIPRIKEQLLSHGYNQPIIGDFHYNGHILLRKYPDCARALDKYRVNPGNVGLKGARGENFAAIIKTAIKFNKPVRIGVNWASLDQSHGNSLPIQDAMVNSALESAKAAEKLGLAADKIVLSVKMSEVRGVIAAYEKLAAQCRYALHLGLTEAGSGDKGLIASTAALAVLLQKGIGDTIRFSLTPDLGQDPLITTAARHCYGVAESRYSASKASRALHLNMPADPRSREVKACQLLLQTMGLRSFRPMVTSCPGCGRTSSDLFLKIAAKVNEHIDQKLPVWRSSLSKNTFNRIANLKIAVMGCIVNGPGEASRADIGLFLPGRAETPIAQVYLKGKPYKKLTGKNIAGKFIAMLDQIFFER
jgi:(E)-4-hydroxy-3-methylbut-2-enyl-diphosphate synthase